MRAATGKTFERAPHLDRRQHASVDVAERSRFLPEPLQRRPSLGSLVDAAWADVLAAANSAGVTQGASDQRPDGVAGLGADEARGRAGHDGGVRLRLVNGVGLDVEGRFRLPVASVLVIDAAMPRARPFRRPRRRPPGQRFVRCVQAAEVAPQVCSGARQRSLAAWPGHAMLTDVAPRRSSTRMSGTVAVVDGVSRSGTKASATLSLPTQASIARARCRCRRRDLGTRLAFRPCA